MPTSEDLEKLRRHHNATIGLFVAFWIYFIVVIVAVEFLDLPERMNSNLIAVLFAAAIVIALLQFAKRCPSCRANLGWQVRLGVPKTCHRCGATLRGAPDRDAGDS